MDFTGPVAYSSRGAQCHLFKKVVRVHVTHRLPPIAAAHVSQRAAVDAERVSYLACVGVKLRE